MPQCEVCQEDTYNLACQRCRLRICNACRSRGHLCACYDEFGNYIGYDSDEESWYTHMSDYTDSENENCFALANRKVTQLKSLEIQSNGSLETFSMAALNAKLVEFDQEALANDAIREKHHH